MAFCSHQLKVFDQYCSNLLPARVCESFIVSEIDINKGLIELKILQEITFDTPLSELVGR